MKIRTLVSLSVLAAMLAGCSTPGARYAASANYKSAGEMEDVSAFASVENIDSPLSASEAQGAAAQTEFGSQAGRSMVYTATLHMSVDNTRAAFTKAAALTKEAGGYVQESNNSGGVLRVPVGKADAVMQQIEQLGTVSDRRVVGTDVTDSYMDTDIRLGNLRTMRERLAALLEKAEKVEDALKIEQEMTRVVTDIERLEAVLARLKNQISFVTLTLMFNQNLPQPAAPKLPVPWVNGVGMPPSALPHNSTTKLPYRLEMPKDFAILSGTAYTSRHDSLRQLHAISADDCTLRLTRRDALEGSSFEFWRTLVRRSLQEVNSVQLKTDETVRINGVDAAQFEGVRGRGNSYLLVMMMVRDEIYLFEFWGPAAAFDSHLEAIRSSYNSIRFGWWK